MAGGNEARLYVANILLLCVLANVVHGMNSMSGELLLLLLLLLLLSCVIICELVRPE